MSLWSTCPAEERDALFIEEKSYKIGKNWSEILYAYVYADNLKTLQP